MATNTKCDWSVADPDRVLADLDLPIRTFVVDVSILRYFIYVKQIKLLGLMSVISTH